MVRYRSTKIALFIFIVVFSSLIGVYIGHTIAEDRFIKEKKELAIVNANLLIEGLELIRKGESEAAITYYQNTLCGYLLGLTGSFLSFTKENYLAIFSEKINEYVNSNNLVGESCPALK